MGGGGGGRGEWGGKKEREAVEEEGEKRRRESDCGSSLAVFPLLAHLLQVFMYCMCSEMGGRKDVLMQGARLYKRIGFVLLYCVSCICTCLQLCSTPVLLNLIQQHLAIEGMHMPTSFDANIEDVVLFPGLSLLQSHSQATPM